MEDLTGQQFGAYRIVAPLGEGGMAAVYKAYQPGMDRYVALKVLPRQFAREPEFVTRFQREARVLAQLQHPHILPVFDFGQADDYTYLVMPHITGGTLTQALTGHPLPHPQTRALITQIGEALDYAHSHGVIHRDVKPSNVLLDERGNGLLSDFGLAKIVEGSSHLTNTGAVVGTPAYMSPEQGSGNVIDARSDLYSLGVILYELATGRTPYVGETPVAVMIMHITDPLPPPRTVNPDLPEALERVILKALAKNPDDRFQTARALVHAVQAALPEQSAFVLPVTSPTPLPAVAAPPPALPPALPPAPPPTPPAALSGKPPRHPPPPAPAASRTGIPRSVWIVSAVAVLLLGGCAIVAIGSFLVLSNLANQSPRAATAIVLVISATPEAATLTPPASPSAPLSATPTATVTPTPTIPPSPTALPPSPTWPLPSLTIRPRLTATTPMPQLPACAIVPSGAFANLWAAHAADLGCPKSAAPNGVQDAEQIFQNGHMLWRQDTDEYYVVYDAGAATQGGWARYPSKYNEGGSVACPDAAPPGLFKPVMGFANVWCGIGGAQAPIGWGMDSEYGFTGADGVRVQDFEKGVIFQDSDGTRKGLVYVFFFGTGRFVRAAP